MKPLEELYKKLKEARELESYQLWELIRAMDFLMLLVRDKEPGNVGFSKIRELIIKVELKEAVK